VHFDGQSRHFSVVEIGRQAQRFLLRSALDFILLAFDVAGVFEVDLNLLALGLAQRNSGAKAGCGNAARVS
jgi:hypothetical protein